jgi:hypothetical protein
MYLIRSIARHLTLDRYLKGGLNNGVGDNGSTPCL